MIDYDPYLSARIVANAKRAGIAGSLLVLIRVACPIVSVVILGARQEGADNITNLISLPVLMVIIWSLIWMAVGLVRQWVVVQEQLLRFFLLKDAEARSHVDGVPIEDRKHDGIKATKSGLPDIRE